MSHELKIREPKFKPLQQVWVIYNPVVYSKRLRYSKGYDVYTMNTTLTDNVIPVKNKWVVCNQFTGLVRSISAKYITTSINSKKARTIMSYEIYTKNPKYSTIKFEEKYIFASLKDAQLECDRLNKLIEQKEDK